MPTFLDNLTEYNAKASLAISQAVADGNLPKANMMSSLKSTANDTTLSEEIRLNALTALINLGSLLTIPLPPYFPVVTTFPDTQVYVGLHNELSGLQGGQAGEFYHLTQAQWTALGSAASAADISFENLQGDYTDNASLVGGFNSKQDALSGTGFVKINGTTISYDNSTYLTALTGIASGASFGGEVSGTYDNLTLVNNAVIGKTLTGWNGSATYSAITPNDSILSGMEKLNARISDIISNPAGVSSITVGTNATSVLDVSPTTPPGTGAVNVAVNLQSQTQNKFLASPNGNTGVPSFRAIAVDDFPTVSGLSQGQYGSSTLIPQVTVDTKGRITAITTIASASGGQVNSVTFSGPGGVFLDSNTGTAVDPIVGFTLDDVPINTVWAGPSSGAAGQPAFRALVLDDIAGITIPQSQIEDLSTTLATFLQATDLSDGTIWIGSSSNSAIPRQLTGDVTVTNEGVTAIGEKKIQFPMIRDITAKKLLGRYSTVDGPPEMISLSGDFVLSNGGTLSLQNPVAPILTTKGDLLSWTAATNSQGRLPSSNTDGDLLMVYTTAPNDFGLQWTTVGGDISVTNAATGEFTIGAKKVTIGKMADLTQVSFLGSNAAGPLYPVQELTATQATAMLNLFDTASTTKGLVPGSDNKNNTYFLDATGYWSQPAGSGTIYPAAQYSIPYYSDSPTGIALSGLAPQTTNGVYFLRANVTASAAVAPDWIGSTGSGSVVLATSPTLVTPNIGVATATSVNGLTITAGTGTLTLANTSTLATAGAFSTTLTATATTNVTLPTTGTLATLAGIETLSNKTLLSPQIGDSATNGHAHFRKAGAAIPPGFSNFATMWFPETGGNKRMAIMWDNVGYASEFQLDATASQTYTFPNATGTVALIDASNVLNVPKSGSTSGAIALGGGTSGTITLQAPATITGAGTYTMPAAYPAAASGYYLTSNTSGVLDWASVTGGGDVTSTATGTPQGNFAIFNDNTGKVINTSSVASLGASPSGRATFNNGVNIGVAASATTGTLVFTNGTTSATTTLLASTSQTTNLIYTWPSGAPAAGNILSSDQNGNLSWTAAGAGNMVLATAGQVVTGSKIYADGTLLIRNPAATFSTTLSAGASTGNWTATFPNASGTIALLSLGQTFTATQTFTGGVTINTTALSVASAATFSASSASAASVVISPATSGVSFPQLSISGGTAQWIGFPTSGAGVGAPTSGARTAGTKIALLPTTNFSTAVDTGLGVETVSTKTALWLQADSVIKLYPNQANSTTGAVGQFQIEINTAPFVYGLNLNGNSTSTAPNLLINGGSNNYQWLSFGTNTNVGPPNATTRTNGTKITLWQSNNLPTNLDAALGIDTGNILWFSSPSNIRFYPNNSTTSAGQWAYGTAANDAVRGLHLNSPSSTNNTESQLLIAGTGSQSYTISFGSAPPLSPPTQMGAAGTPRGTGKKIVLQESTNTYFNTESAIGRETGFMWLCDPGGIRFYTNNTPATARMQIDSSGLTLADAANLIFNTTTGTKIGTATGQKLAFWNKTPIVQPTTAITGAAFAQVNTTTAVSQASTFGGYTLQQIAAALINTGILA